MRLSAWGLMVFVSAVVAFGVLVLWDCDNTAQEARAAQAPDDSACRGCHNSSTPFIVDDFESGDMGQSGVRCTDCHHAQATDPDAISHNGYTITTKPSAKDCGACHSDEVTEFNSSKHYLGWTKMEQSARWLDIPGDIRSAMCDSCHNIGQISPDGSRGKCDSCHTRHSFSAEEARKPESCGTCHMGPDHPQIEAYLSSKHGVMYSLEGESWDWSDPASFTAPVCTTCHMPGGTHNVGYGISIGGTSAGAVITGYPTPFPMNNITMSQFAEKRAEMLDVCSQCHSRSFAEEWLSTTDAVKNETDMLVGEARNIILNLYNDGLLDPMPADRAPNPITGYNLTLMGHQTYSNTSGIETIFFQMYKYHGVTAWKGGYHFSPDHTHWYGWAEVNHDLDLIKAEDAELRARADLQDRLAEIDTDGDDSSIPMIIGTAALALALIALLLSVVGLRRMKTGPPKT
jgi:hypothetical protein